MSGTLRGPRGQDRGPLEYLGNGLGAGKRLRLAFGVGMGLQLAGYVDGDEGHRRRAGDLEVVVNASAGLAVDHWPRGRISTAADLGEDRGIKCSARRGARADAIQAAFNRASRVVRNRRARVGGLNSLAVGGVIRGSKLGMGAHAEESRECSGQNFLQMLHGR